MRSQWSKIFLVDFTQEWNWLVFCKRPWTYADLDNMFVYSHNIPYNDHTDTANFGLQPNAELSFVRANAVVPSPSRASGYTCRNCHVKLSMASSRAPQAHMTAPRLAHELPTSSYGKSSLDHHSDQHPFTFQTQSILRVASRIFPPLHLEFGFRPVKALIDSGAVLFLTSATVYKNLALLPKHPQFK
jgi:hypothetical protein